MLQTGNSVWTLFASCKKISTGMRAALDSKIGAIWKPLEILSNRVMWIQLKSCLLPGKNSSGFCTYRGWVGFPKLLSSKSKSRKIQGKSLISHWTPDLSDNSVKFYRGWPDGKSMEKSPGAVFERLGGKCLCKKGFSERNWKWYRESRMRAWIIKAFSQDLAGWWLPHSQTQ